MTMPSCTPSTAPSVMCHLVGVRFGVGGLGFGLGLFKVGLGLGLGLGWGWGSGLQG